MSNVGGTCTCGADRLTHEGGRQLIYPKGDYPCGACEAWLHTPSAPSQAGTGLKFDEGKPRLDLIPGEALFPVGAVLAYGVEKYDKVNKAYNWREGMAWSRPLAACLRHVFKWAMGERYDIESGKPHLAHAIVNLMFLLTYEETGGGVDDRFKKGTP